MGRFVQPKAFFVGATAVNMEGLEEYLRYTHQEDFLETWKAGKEAGLSDGECLVSFYGKLCYKSLVADGRNANITRVRDIPDNLIGLHKSAHGSVWEHVQLNFIVTDCSRIMTHEQVRHRIAAYSQTSGRYCRLDSIDLVWDPILDPARDIFEAALQHIEDAVYLAECRLGLRQPPNLGLPHPDKSIKPEECLTRRDSKAAEEHKQVEKYRWVPDNSGNFDFKKKLTSAIRRIAPNGQSNEIGMSFNLRTMRHLVQLRTARFAEREIRLVYNQIYQLLKDKFPTLFYGAIEKDYDGLLEVSGMKLQPYDAEYTDPQHLRFFDTETLQAEIDKRAQYQASQPDHGV